MPHSVHIAHHTHGRLRLLVSGAKGSPRILSDIAGAVRELPEVKDCRINPRARSVVIQYDPNHRHEFRDHMAALGNASGIFEAWDIDVLDPDSIISGVQREARFLSQHSETASRIINGFTILNEMIKQLTHNFVDLNVLLPLALAVLALLGLGVDSGTPLWVTLAIFSFNSFLVLHSPWRIPQAA